MSEKNSASRLERAFRIVAYLKKHTDKDHPTSQAKMRGNERIKDYIGHKKTFNQLIRELADIMNFDEQERLKKEEDWRICFEDFTRRYGEEMDEELQDEEFDEEEVVRIRDLYYRQEFSYEEVNELIEGVLSTKTINTKQAEKLIEKIEEHLTTDYYRNDYKQICKIREPELVDRETLKNNLQTIQKAINNNVQIAFYFNGYNHRKKLEHVRPMKDVISPYYVVADAGRYYLLACKEVEREGKVLRNMSIWRIDLMSEVEIPGVKEKLGIPGIARIPKREVANLPQEWNDEFQLKHPNMAYDKPEKIRLRIISEKQPDDPRKHKRPDYTFLHDWFGETFRYIGADPEVPDCDLVEVECSPYAMGYWALQYCDRVEVLEPKHVREEIKKKVEDLYKKYQ